MRSVDDDDIYVVGECAQHRGQVYGLVAPLWEQAKVLADHLTGADTQRRLPRFADRDQAQGGRRRRRVDGHQGARACPTTSSCSSPSPSTGVYKTIVIRDGKLVGATLVGDVARSSFLTQAFDQRPAAARRTGVADVRHRHPRRRGRRRPSWPTTRRSATATASARARSSAACAAARTSVSGVMADDQGRQGLRLVQGAGRRRSSSGRPAAPSTEDPSANWYVPGVPYDKPTLMRA